MSVTPESVKQLLSSDDFGDRLRAVNQFRQLDPSIAFELAQTASADSNTRVRYAAVSQISELGKQDRSLALTLLRDRLQDSEPDVQAAAADSLGALQLTEALTDLQQLYHRTSEWLVKFSIVATLGALGDPQAFEILEDAIQSDNELVQTAAIGSLGELGDDRAIPLLLPLVTHADWQIRYRVTQALISFKGSEVESALATLANDEMDQIAQEAKSHLTSA